jgi:hypothetical protein
VGLSPDPAHALMPCDVMIEARFDDGFRRRFELEMKLRKQRFEVVLLRINRVEP